MRSLFAILLCLAVHSPAFALATNLLYTGDAFTVPPGRAQAQASYGSTFGGPQRTAGAALTFGATKRLDVRLGYGHLWSDVGPDVKLGPNVAVKWRVIGDGLRKPSVALSTLCAVNNGIDGRPHKSDFGGLLIVQYPTRPAVFLLNLGHARVGDNGAPDIGNFGFAAVRKDTGRTLVALEYSKLDRIGGVVPQPDIEQISAGLVYIPTRARAYGVQFSYLPLSRDTRFHLALGVSAYL